jgi:alkylation response protein AidB-like acyl-CoA dehydrogenase
MLGAMTQTADGLLERTQAILPVLAANAARTEELRRAVPESIEALTEAGVFRMTVAKHYGGYESDLLTQYDVLSAISSACPSTGWVATILTAMLWNMGMFSDEAQDEVFADPRARIASVFAPGGHASRTGGGVRVSGRWPFNTGCHHAQWAILTALLDEGAGPAPVSLLIPYQDLTILDDWDATGMAGTGSNTTVADDVFVPEHRLLPIERQITLELASARNAANPYFHKPLVSFLIGQAAAAPVGIARGAFAAFMQRLPGRSITYTTYTDQSAAPVTHIELAEAAMRIESAHHHARRANELVDGAAAGLTLEERARVRAHAAYATRLARESVSVLYEASGASAIQSSVPIQRYQRDIQALANHAFLAAPTALELYGRVVCGLEPNTQFI